MKPELAYSYRVQAGLPNALNEHELRSLQLKRLNQTISYAQERCSFHRHRLPKDPLSSLEELASLPLMDASAFEGGIGQLLGRSQAEVKRLVTLPTSGTTGEPKRIAFTQKEHQSIVEYLAAGMRMLAEPGETIAVLYPCEHTGGLGQLICESIGLAGAKACAYGLPTSKRGFADLARTCIAQQVRGLVGFPQHVYALSVWAQYRGVELPVQRVLLSADTVAPRLKQAVKQNLQVEVFAHYGTTEMGYGGAVECGHECSSTSCLGESFQEDAASKDASNPGESFQKGTVSEGASSPESSRCGMHVRETDLLFEVVDPQSGAVHAPGEWGELVFTTLNREAMPFIRYRTGDLTRLLPGACACGSCLQRIDAVKNRADSRLPFGMYELEEAAFAQPGLMDFHARWKEEGSLLLLEVQLLPGSEAELSELSSTLAQELDVRVEIRHRIVEDFDPMYAGKRSIQRV